MSALFQFFYWQKTELISLNSSSSSTAWSSSAIMWDGCDFLNAFYPETGSCQGSDGCLRAWAWCSWS
jgi:hypothetical protein